MGYIEGKWEDEMANAGAGADQALWAQAAKSLGYNKINSNKEVINAVAWINEHNANKANKPSDPVVQVPKAGIDYFVPTTVPISTQPSHDPNLEYGSSANPGDNPYISNFKPVQESYMNDPSTLSAEELDYRNQNIKGLDDRSSSIENAGQFLNDWILDLSNDPNRQTETQIDTGSPEDSDKNPYDQYRTKNYY